MFEQNLIGSSETIWLGQTIWRRCCIQFHFWLWIAFQSEFQFADGTAGDVVLWTNNDLSVQEPRWNENLTTLQTYAHTSAYISQGHKDDEISLWAPPTHPKTNKRTCTQVLHYMPRKSMLILFCLGLESPSLAFAPLATCLCSCLFSRRFRRAGQAW